MSDGPCPFDGCPQRFQSPHAAARHVRQEHKQIATDGGEMTAEGHLRQAVEHLVIAREGVDKRVDPGQDAAVARAEMMIRGVADAIGEGEGRFDDHLVTDGGTAEEPEPRTLDDNDPRGVVQAIELHLDSDEPDWQKIADGAAFLRSYALQRRGEK